MVKTSVLMTVHDREPEVLLSTLRSLHRCGLAEAELVIVDDRSGMDYSWIREYAKPRFATVKWIPTGEYEGFRVEGYGNPAHAFNVGLEICTGERLVVMSSDVVIAPKAVWSLDRFWTPEAMWTPRVIDLDSCYEYCGSKRPFPMPWFLAMPTKVAQASGGWDERFLGGFCYEDNDFVARMFKSLGVIRCDWDAFVYHQSHVQPAYDVKSEDVASANLRNRDICMTKWSGIPFDNETAAFTIYKRPDAMGCTRLECEVEAISA